MADAAGAGLAGGAAMADDNDDGVNKAALLFKHLDVCMPGDELATILREFSNSLAARSSQIAPRDLKQCVVDMVRDIEAASVPTRLVSRQPCHSRR